MVLVDNHEPLRVFFTFSLRFFLFLGQIIQVNVFGKKEDVATIIRFFFLSQNWLESKDESRDSDAPTTMKISYEKSNVSQGVISMLWNGVKASNQSNDSILNNAIRKLSWSEAKRIISCRFRLHTVDSFSSIRIPRIPYPCVSEFKSKHKK